ncbi:copper resistance protein CopC [uncultured Leifsonia sp.]|uniref:copper resistance CopC family protein n=1 Tax=uncultured Leifsonia sp. TaxID=340359 RepID=UPI0028D4DAFF|nr:copper resistance protein CopC [uncultured Leifsonia sp.]
MAAAALAFAPAVAASAHDYLVESSPAAGSVQTVPLDRVSLTFNDRVLDLSGDGSSALVQVTAANGRHFETGCASIADRTVSAPVALGQDGRYTVEWQIVSADGHTVSDSLVFDYRAPAGAARSEGSPDRPGCGAAREQPAAAGTSTPAPAAAKQDDAVGLVIGIAVGIVVLAAVGVLVVVLTARRSRRSAPSGRPSREPSREEDDE